MENELVTGDTLPTLRVTVVDGQGAAFDMTGMTAVFRWKGPAGLVEKPAAIAGAVASYQFAAGDIVASKMKIELEITDLSGNKITATELIVIAVREQLG